MAGKHEEETKFESRHRFSCPKINPFSRGNSKVIRIPCLFESRYGKEFSH